MYFRIFRNGTDIHTCNNKILMGSIKNEHIKTVKYLIKRGQY
jgi:hypothetical protein